MMPWKTSAQGSDTTVMPRKTAAGKQKIFINKSQRFDLLCEVSRS